MLRHKYTVQRPYQKAVWLIQEEQIYVLNRIDFTIEILRNTEMDTSMVVYEGEPLCGMLPTQEAEKYKDTLLEKIKEGKINV